MDSGKLKIHLWPEEVLEKRAEDVTDFNKDSIKDLLPEMIDLMHKTRGIGLAAPQIGISKRFFIMLTGYIDNDISNADTTLFVNPQIIEKSEDMVGFEEGCLSLPNYTVPTERYAEVLVSYQDYKGKTKQKRFKGLESICFQHEYDHLEGITILDKIPSKKKREKAKIKMIEQKALLSKKDPDTYK